MPRPIFYHQVIKTLITVFGSIFDDFRFIDDEGNEITVPLHYSPKEKFYTLLLEKTDPDMLSSEIVLPRFGFEMTGMSFASERFTNPLNRIRESSTDESFMYNRLPYDFEFTLYLATRKFEESLKVIEQIVPIFTPEFNVTINDLEDFNLRTDVPVTMNSMGFNIDWEGAMDTKRTILWTLGFTMKAWLYGDIKQQAVIKETIMNLAQDTLEKKFATYISEVVPREARKIDPHTIINREE